MRGLLKSDLHVVAEIVAPLGLGHVGSAAAEEVFEDPPAAENLAEDLEWIVEPPGAISARPAVEGGVAVLIVEGALLGIAQDFIGLAEFFELLLSRLVPRVLIRVILNCELAVGLFNLLRFGLSRYAEDL